MKTDTSQFNDLVVTKRRSGVRGSAWLLAKILAARGGDAQFAPVVALASGRSPDPEPVMRRIGFASLSLLALALFVVPLQAQTAQRFSLQFSGLNARLTAIQSDDAAFGQGGEIQLRFNPSAFSIGLGFQTTTHSIENVDITFEGFFLEPRYVIAVGSERFALYLSARAMTLTPTLEVSGVGSVEGDSGSAIAGGGGLLVSLGSRVNLDLGATAGKEFYDGRAADGATIVTRLGLAIGLF